MYFKKTFLALIIFFIFIGCSGPTHIYTVEIVYIDGTLDTIKMEVNSNVNTPIILDEGCIRRPASANSEKCGVRSYKVIEKKEIQ